MSSEGWNQELEKMLTNIDRQATSSLRNISNCFERSGQSFHQEDQKYCLKRSIDRLNEMYSKFENGSLFDKSRNRSVQLSENSSTIASISTENNDQNPIVEISDDEDSDERSNTRSQVSRETAVRNVDREIKTEDDESDDQASGEEVPNIVAKEEEMEDDGIPIVRVSANQLMGTYMNVVKVESHEDHNKENIANGVKRERSNSPKMFDDKENNVCEPHKKKTRVSKRRVASKDTSRKINGKSNANTTNEVEVNVPRNVRSGQSTLDKWISQKNKSNGNKEQSNKRIGGQTRGNNTNIQRSQKNVDTISKISSDIKTHSGEKPYQCDHCPKQFSRYDHLIIHTRSHTGEKPYQCGHCKKRFSQNSSLTMHIRIHTGEKPYQCDQCKKRFSYLQNIKIHMRTHKNSLFHCSGCHRGFIRNIEKEAHERE
ncbi:zinc finger protein 483-like, partial [Contarinia nasturtii]|uniref:zinc finger protein 483-like n=1 Tax=Contarinia nasturtii TaxID=265458 RepID=UPI0012D4BD43